MGYRMLAAALVWSVAVGVGAQSPPEVPADEAFPLSDDELEIVSLKIDLLEAAALTLQWKREALVHVSKYMAKALTGKWNGQFCPDARTTFERLLLKVLGGKKDITEKFMLRFASNR